MKAGSKVRIKTDDALNGQEGTVASHTRGIPGITFCYMVDVGGYTLPFRKEEVEAL